MLEGGVQGQLDLGRRAHIANSKAACNAYIASVILPLLLPQAPARPQLPQLLLLLLLLCGCAGCRRVLGASICCTSWTAA
jgi:hypothetical protein